MDTMTLTKIAAGVLGAWLVLLLAKWGGEELYHADAHGEASYVIEVEEAEPAAGEEEVPFAEILASADIAKGAKVFKKCTSCHKIEEGASGGSGPVLYGVVGRDIASLAGFGYSGALNDLDGDWDAEALNGFLTKPSAYAKGTTMGFNGLKKVQDRANVIAYLDSLDD